MSSIQRASLLPLPLSILFIILLSSAPVANARAVAWYDFFYRATEDSTSWQPPAVPTLHPEATDAAAPAVTSPPQVAAVELMMKRAVGVSTCGYFQGSSDVPFLCGGGGTCGSYAGSSAIGCCPGGTTGCSLGTACINYAGYTNGLCKTLKPGTGCCGMTNLPYCATFSFLDIGMTMMQCAASPVTGIIEMGFSPTALNGLKPPTPKPAVLSTNNAPALQETADQSSATQTAKPATTEGGGGSGLSQSDKIALGCGIGIGVPTAIATIWMFFRMG